MTVEEQTRRQLHFAYSTPLCHECPASRLPGTAARWQYSERLLGKISQHVPMGGGADASFAAYRLRFPCVDPLGV